MHPGRHHEACGDRPSRRLPQHRHESGQVGGYFPFPSRVDHHPATASAMTITTSSTHRARSAQPKRVLVLHPLTPSRPGGGTRPPRWAGPSRRHHSRARASASGGIEPRPSLLPARILWAQRGLAASASAVAAHVVAGPSFRASWTVSRCRSGSRRRGGRLVVRRLGVKLKRPDRTSESLKRASIVLRVVPDVGDVDGAASQNRSTGRVSPACR
jgi:hypothetical protein